MNVYITGISGTLGTAFVKLLYADNDIYGIDRNEEQLSKLIREYPRLTVQCGEFADVDLEGMDVVIHLAAMKHIDLCETNPNAAVMNNVLKTHVLFKTAKLQGVDILFMSTDKAVEPQSVYGYTKALGEMMAQEYGGAYARSGNILHSTGSVLNIWEEAIQRKQPIKITHRDMHRYFISPDNLAKRIWELYCKGERVIIPKMDKDTMLIDLANDKLAEHSYTLDTYPYGVEYTGLRPGEKLKEKLEWN